MKLHHHLRPLLEAIAITRETEFDCEACSRHLAELAELPLAPERPLSRDLDLTQHHLAVCQECQEDFQMLRQSLK